MDFLPLVQPPDWPVIFPPQNLVVRLYQIQTDVPLAVAEVISATQSLFDRGEISFPVFADPNYITGFQPVPLSADPWDIGGAPWDIGGATVTATSSLAQVEYFWPQWALNTSEGIAIIDAPPTRTVTYTGAAKHVVVFDTSPFTGSMRVFFQGWLTPDFRVCVSHPQPGPLPALDLSPHPLVPDHGLFAAGLVYGVVPEVEIDLVRALNNEGQGDMFWLLANMAGYAARASRSGTELRGVGVLSDTVFNLSLGVHPTTPTESIGLTPEQVEWIKTVTRGPLGALGNWGAVDPPVVALETVLSILHQHNGATIVAAAGNGSANTGEPPYEANMPARYPFVIGVSGSNVERTQACFSNMGLVAAPAGDGGRPLASVTPATTAQPPCYPQFENKPCPDRVSGDCRWGVISVVVAKHLGFAIWAGTSFATPLVSGLAALELEAGIPYTQVLTHTLESVDVSGVVSVPNAVVP
jgi:subtilisin family serine protease